MHFQLITENYKRYNKRHLLPKFTFSIRKIKFLMVLLLNPLYQFPFRNHYLKKDNYIKLREEQITLGLKLRKRPLNTNYYFNLEAEQKDHHIVL